MEQKVFQQRIQALTDRAMAQDNVLTREEVGEYLKDLTKEQLQAVYEYLAANHIRVKGTMQAAREEEESTPMLDFYMEEIQKVEELSEQEEEALFLAYVAGEAEAGEKLVGSRLPFVVELAQDYGDRGVLLEDLIQEGNLGLLEGLHQAKEGKELSAWRKILETAVMEAMEACIYQQGSEENLGEQMVSQSEALQESVAKLTEDLGKKPNFHELVDYLDLPEEQVEDLLRLSGDAIELEADNHHHHHHPEEENNHE